MACKDTSRGLKCALLLACLLVHSQAARAGGGPQNVLVVINDQSIESQEVGLLYRATRGIPERNLCRVSVDPYLYNATNIFFQTAIVARVQQHIADYGLSNQIDYIVLCKELPSRVNANEGATAVLFYGFKSAPPIISTCSMPTNTRSAYYKAERGFSRRDKYGGTNLYLAMMLTAKTLYHSISNIQRGAAADGTAPTGTIYLLAPPTDGNRNIRYKLFSGLNFESRFWSAFPQVKESYNNAEVNRKDVLGYLTGIANYPDWFWSTNDFRPGALADHLTSWGGRLPEPGGGQSPITEWIRAGATASYGTVAEPCAYMEKFPDPMAYFWYFRGFNLAESYWMSVANPYQGLFIGEPLAAPYARPPGIVISGPASNQVVSGVVTVQVAATTNALGLPPRALDLYLDDLWVGTLTNVGPAAGNVMSAVIGGVTCSYAVTTGDTLYSAVTGLAASINASNTPVRAEAYGDRIRLVYTNYGQAGSGITYGTATSIGTATVLSVWGLALSSNLLESIYPAREYLSIVGTANTGDTVTCKITLTNGVVVTNQIIAQQGQAGTALIALLKNLINSNAALQATAGVRAVTFTYQATQEMTLEARKPGPEGYNLFVDFQVTQASPPGGLSTGTSFSDNFDDTEEYVFNDPVRTYSILTAQGNILFWTGQEPLEADYAWDTTAVPNGRHTIRAVACDGAATETQGHAVIPVLVSNSAFACVLAAPTNGETTVLGSNVYVEASVTNESGGVTQVVFYVEDKPGTVLTNAPFVTAWSTLDYGVGQVSVRAQAWDGTGQSALSDAAWVEIQRSPTLDTDGDDAADSWEQENFGGLYVYRGTNDPDGDGFVNSNEYVAATNPNDSNSFFQVAVGSETNWLTRLSFFSATGRVYAIQYNSGYLTNFNNWLVASNSPFPGIGGITNWVDDGSETEPPIAETTQRIYRVRVNLP
ncbi:MAG: TIGR03790 family protein [Verrucomicrobia bacterium]|nr:TIGR03790 family protein [Verrucomicrobiota bacterium]